MTPARLITVVLLLLAIRLPCAEGAVSPLTGYTLTNWTPREGAPTYITGIVQTTDGTLWLASPSGLFQFDGIRFRRYGDAPNEALPSQYLRTLTAPATGGLWIGFQLGGVAFLKDGALTVYSVKEGLPEGTVHRILVDRTGTIWIATTAGLGKLVNGRWHAVEGLTANAGALLETRSGVIWARVGDEILFKRPGEEVFTRPADVGEYADVRDDALVEAPDGTVWVVGTQHGLRTLARETAPYLPDELMRDRDLRGGKYWQLLFEEGGALWYISESELHRIANPAVLRSPATAAQVRDEGLEGGQKFLQGSIAVAYFDREGSLWLGASSGLIRLARTAFHVVASGETLTFTLSSSKDDNMVWAQGTPGGTQLVHVQRGHIDWRAPVSVNLTAAHRDAGGTFWFGSSDAIWRLNGRTLIPIRYPKDLAGMDTQAVLRDGTGALWTSIRRRGVFRYVDGQWQKNGGLDGLPQEPAIAMANDAAGRIWLAYANARVGLVTGSTARTFGVSDGLPEVNITSIGTRGDHIWIGSEAGLHWFDGMRFIALHVANDLVFRGLWGIVETSTGELWTAGAAGITHLTAKQVERAKASGHLDEAVEMFGIADGVPGGVQSLRPTPALVEDGDGKLWVALTGGIGYIDPSDLPRNRVPPPVHISSLLASGREYSPFDAGIELPAGTTQLRIPYTASSFVAPGRVRFRYRLEGLENEWQDAGDRREATYTNVGPGKYRFQVIAANNDGVWNETGAALSFVVLPTFYQTWWFYALCILAGVALLTLLYRLRLRQVTAAVRQRLEERIVERERIARELHDTLLQGVQGLILRFQAGTNRVSPQDPGRKVLESALERADQVLIEGRNRVKGLRASAQMQGDLPQAIAKVGEQLAQDSDSEVRFSMAIEGEPRSLHPILNEEAFMIVREALTNAFRHSCASKVEAEVTFSHAELRLRVRDNGRGIPAAALADGGTPGHWGLPGMRERAQRIRGQLEIWSREGAGTEVQLRIRASLAYREPGNRDVGELVT